MDEKQKVTVSKAQEIRYQHTQFAEQFFVELVSTKEYFPSGEELLRILEIFWENPCDAIRKACVEKVRIFMLNDSHYTVNIPNEMALWFEERIPLIVETEFFSVFEYWKQLLGAYVFNAGDAQTKIRAVEFAISFFLSEKGHNKESIRPILSKMIAGAIRKHPELYWAPSVPEFLEASIAHENWTIVERVLKLICAANDTSFLTHISDLGRRAEEARNKAEDYKATSDFKERFAAAKARGVLQETVRHLFVHQTEEEDNIDRFCMELALAFKIHGNLSYVPHVEIHIPSGRRYGIGIHVSPSNSSRGNYYEVVKNFRSSEILSTLLKRCEVTVIASGVEISNAEQVVTDVQCGLKPGSSRYFGKFKNSRTDVGRIAGCEFSATQSRKTARLTIAVDLLVQGEHNRLGFALTRYVACDA